MTAEERASRVVIAVESRREIDGDKLWGDIAVKLAAEIVAETRTVYVVVLEDRRADVQVEVFAYEDLALLRAQGIANTDRYPNRQPPRTTGFGSSDWLMDIRLSEEGDYIHVEKARVQS